MSIATDVRTYADTALNQGKAVLNQAGTAVASVNKRLVSDAPKPAYAALGAADLVAATVTKRAEALPAEAADNVTKVQQTGRTLLTRSQNDALARITELRGRVDAGLDAVSALPVVARNTTEAYLSTAKDLYGKLTARGEAKAAELRKDPRVTRLIGKADDVAESVSGTVTPVAKSAFDAVQTLDEETKPTEATHKSAPRKATRKPAARTQANTATKPVARRAPRKSTATKSTATKSTASRSTASKRTAVKSTAGKA